MQKEFLLKTLEMQPVKNLPISKYIFLVNDSTVAIMLCSIGSHAVCVDKNFNISEFQEVVKNIIPGKTNVIDFTFCPCLSKQNNEIIIDFLKRQGLFVCEDAWRIFYRREHLKNIAHVDELKKTVEEFARSKESLEVKEINLDKFHHMTLYGKATGVFHYAIFEHIKENFDFFICGGTPYIYENGFYVGDYSGAKLKTIIKKFIYPSFIKSTTINNIYNLFLQDADLEKTFESLNNYPSHWICFKNGMWDCKKKEMLSHSPEYYVINQIPHNYEPNKEVSGPTIENYLSFICEEPDSREMLLQFIGLCLTKDTTQQKFLVLNGEGGSGKSTLIRLIEALVGNRNISNIALTDLQLRFACFGLVAKLLNSCADLEIGALEDTSIIKKCLGEDSLRAEQKGKDAISFKSYAKLIFSTNELPIVKSEKTNGFYRRLLVLTMNKVPKTKNPNLFKELEKELPYLLKLAVGALEELYANGVITESESSKKAILQLRIDSDTTEAFLQEECIRIPNDRERIERGSLYKKYYKFCNDSERQSLTKNNFYKALRAKGFSEIKTGGYVFFKGISYKKDSQSYPTKNPHSSLSDDFLVLIDNTFQENPFT